MEPHHRALIEPAPAPDVEAPAPAALVRRWPALGFGHIVVSEIEVPNMLVNLV